MHRSRPHFRTLTAAALLGSLLLLASACTSSSHQAAPKAAATGAVPTTDPRAASGALSAADTLPWLHVAHDADGSATIVDSAGRQVLPRGVNTEGMEDEATRDGFRTQTAMYYPTDPKAYTGRCPANSNQVAAPLCEVSAGQARFEQSAATTSQNDFAQMRAQGFTTVRLALSWSQLEPTPGNYDTAYLDHVAQIVEWAREQGVYVLLDLHEDQYSRFIQPKAGECPDGADGPVGFDGAPKWAVFTDGKSACGLLGQATLSPGMMAAFDNFWHNRTVAEPQGNAPGTGLQDHYIGMLAALAKRFANTSSVIGYEIMNEPQPGTGNPISVSDDLMYPFYRRAIEAITGVRDGLRACPADRPSGLSVAAGWNAPAAVAGSVVTPLKCAYPDLGIHDTRHLVLFEPLAIRNLADFSTQHSKPFSAYPNLVYAPHTYTHVFTVDASFIGYSVASSPYPATYDYAYATAASEAKTMHAAELVTEFGNDKRDDGQILAGTQLAQQRWNVGGLLWTWKENCSSRAGDPCPGSWSYWAATTSGPGPKPQNGPPNASRVREVRRSEPIAVAGRIVDQRADPASGAFVLDATSTDAVRKGDLAHETLLWVPSGAPIATVVSGAAQLDRIWTNPDGGRAVAVAPTGKGAYTVELGSAVQVTNVRAQMKADPPRRPIATAEAERDLLQFLAAAMKSPTPKISANAGLVEGIVQGFLNGKGLP